MQRIHILPHPAGLTKLAMALTLALGSAEPRQIALLVCDVILGDMSGPAVAEALRALRPNLRTLYMSGYTDDVIARTGALEHERYFMRKPFTPLELAERIRLVLDEAAASSMEDQT